MVQLIIEILTFIVLSIALFVNINRAEQKKNQFAKIKVVAIAAAIVGLIVYFRLLAQYSFILLILGILSISKKKGNGAKQNLNGNN